MRNERYGQGVMGLLKWITWPDVSRLGNLWRVIALSVWTLFACSRLADTSFSTATMLVALGVILLTVPRSPDILLGIATLISFVLCWVNYGYSSINYGYAIIFYMAYLAGGGLKRFLLGGGWW